MNNVSLQFSRSIYQGSLYKILQNDDTPKEVRSLREALDNGFTFYFHETYAEYIDKEGKFFDRIEFISEYDGGNLNQTYNPRFKGAILRTLIEVLHKNSHNLNYKYKKQYLVSTSVVLYYPKNFFLIPDIDRKLGLLQASGLIDYWTYNFTKHFSIERLSDQQPRKILLKHLGIVFQIAAGGWILSCSVFVIEIVSGKIRILNIFKRLKCMKSA